MHLRKKRPPPLEDVWKMPPPSWEERRAPCFGLTVPQAEQRAGPTGGDCTKQRGFRSEDSMLPPPLPEQCFGNIKPECKMRSKL